MRLVKLGGSVITDKDRLRSFRRNDCLRLCRELSMIDDALVLVHGAGSFGHILASEGQLHQGVDSSDKKRLGLAERVHQDVLALDSMVLDCMDEAGMHGRPLSPRDFGKFSSGEMTDFRAEKFEDLLSEDAVPVSFGDVVPDSVRTVSICSGDLVMLALARHFRPDEVIFVADVDGVFDRDPKEHPDARLIEEISPEDIDGIAAGTRKNDVTGAMRDKLARMIEIARHCENCIILNGNSPGRLEGALKGEHIVSTRVIA